MSKSLAGLAYLKVVSWPGSQRWLPLVLVYLFLRSTWLLLTEKFDLIHTGDALLSPLTLFFKKTFKKPVTVTVFGLDVLWGFRPYRKLIRESLNRLDRIVCISRETRTQSINLGVDDAKIRVVPVGVRPGKFQKLSDRNRVRALVSKMYDIPLEGGRIILSVGRLVKRKGFQWFVEEVLPEVLNEREDARYLMVGSGPLRRAIQSAISRNGLEMKAFILGRVEDDQLGLIYNSADIFVMPNIPVPGDIEGFGIVALEAASCGIPVVASDLQGIKDAVQEGMSGFLLPPHDVHAFSRTIVKLLDDSRLRREIGERARGFAVEHFSWDKIASEYVHIMEETKDE